MAKNKDQGLSITLMEAYLMRVILRMVCLMDLERLLIRTGSLSSRIGYRAYPNHTLSLKDNEFCLYYS